MSNPNPQATFGQYKVRKFTTGNKTGDAFGITLPRSIGEKFKEVKVTIDVSSSNEPVTLEPGTYIILKSGLDIMKLK